MINDRQREDIERELIPFVERKLREWLRGVNHGDMRAMARSHLSISHVEEKMSVIERYLPGYIREGSRILEIGAGFGAFTAYCRAQRGWNVVGIEPDLEIAGCASRLGALTGHPGLPISCGTGEHLSYANGSFDLVYSSNVLEHVRDPERVLAEALRVLRPGGVLFFTIPNYGSWWEGHYAILWLPNLSKRVAKLYVRLCGRDPAYIDGLNFITAPGMRRVLDRFGAAITVLTMGQELWEERLTTMQFGTWGAAGSLRRLVMVLSRLRFLLRPLIVLGKRFNWHYPLVVVVRKNA